jgi:hypothetical protein
MLSWKPAPARGSQTASAPANTVAKKLRESPRKEHHSHNAWGTATSPLAPVFSHSPGDNTQNIAHGYRTIQLTSIVALTDDELA